MPAILDRCVKQVSAQQRKKGKDAKAAKSAAFAICNSSLKKSGKLSDEEVDRILNEFESKEFETDVEVETWLSEQFELAAKKPPEDDEDAEEDDGVEDDSDDEEMKKKKNELSEEKSKKEGGVSSKKYRSISSVIKLSGDAGKEGKGIKVHMIRTGAWEHPLYGLFRVNPATLEQFVKNFDANIPQEHIAFDFRHQPDLGAAAWVTSLEVKDNYLVGTVDLTDEGLKAIQSGRFRYFSTEYIDNYKDAESGNEHGATILGGGLTNRPFIKGMPPVMLSQDNEGEVETILTEVYEDMDKIQALEAKLKELEDAIKALTETKNAEGDKARLAELESQLGEAQKSLEATKTELEEARKELACKGKDEEEMKKKKAEDAKKNDDVEALKERIRLLEEENASKTKVLETIGTEHRANKKALHEERVKIQAQEWVKAGIPPAVTQVFSKFALAEFETPTTIKLSEEGKEKSFSFSDAVKAILEAWPKEHRVSYDEESKSPRGETKLFEDQDDKLLEDAEAIVAEAHKTGTVVKFSDAVVEAAKRRSGRK